MISEPMHKNRATRAHQDGSILDHFPQGVVIFEVIENGKDFVFNYINKAVETIENVQKEDLIGQSAVTVFPGISDMGLLEALKKVHETGQSTHFPTTLYRDDHLTGWRDNHISKLTATELLVVYTDETERKEREIALRESEVFFQNVFDTIQDGITVLDPEMNIIKMNRAMEMWYNPESPYLGKKCYQTYHGKSQPCDDCPAKKAIETGNSYSKIVPRGGPAGTPGWIELTAFPVLNYEGQTIGAVEYVRNITERKTAQEALKNSEQKLKEIIEFLPDPTWVIDTKGTVIQWNQAMERLTGTNSEDILGKGDYEYSLPMYEERRPMLIDLVLAPDKDWESRYEYLRKEGITYTNEETYHPHLGENGTYLSGTASPLYDSGGEVVGAIESVRDVTEKKLMELEKEKVIKEELDKALSNVDLLRGMLPICAWCKNIRDDNGYWNKIEQYIANHSQAEFSHGICPDCAKEIKKSIKPENN